MSHWATSNSGVDTYNLYNAELNFGDGMVTEPTQIGVLTSETRTVNGVTHILPQNQWRALIGASMNTPTNAVFTSNAFQALPDPLGQGLLINQPKDYFEFGANPLQPIVSVSGAPLTDNLTISIDGQPCQSVTGGIDSGGAMGFVPSSLVPNPTDINGVPLGTTIAVAVGTTADPTPLYTQTISSTTPLAYRARTWCPTFVLHVQQRNYPFSQMPIYTSFSPAGVGTIVFDQQP